MSHQDFRNAADTFYPPIRTNRSHNPYSPQQTSMNHMFSEDYIEGFREDGRMSVIRRFFCLFVTFDLIFITLLWIISVVITGENIYHAFDVQVKNYSIYTSLFDIVINALVRFIFLILFYGIIYINHWIVVALTTVGSCGFLISKVFVYDFLMSTQPVFQVLLIVVSFVIAWGEVWFLDCRVIPQERFARNYLYSITSQSVDARTPLMAPFLNSVISGRAESVGNFYSPFESIHNSDEEDEQDDEFKQLGIECVRKAYELLETEGWKIEKVTSNGDTIQSSIKEKIGKVWKLTGKVHYPPKKLLKELYYKIEDVPIWNPTLIESKIIRKIDSHTDITYSASAGGGGGLVKSRDFVNLRCWHLCRDGKIIENFDVNTPPQSRLSTVTENSSLHSQQNNDDSDDPCILKPNDSRTPSDPTNLQWSALSKSLGAKDFVGSDHEDDLYSDAQSDVVPIAANSVPTISTTMPSAAQLNANKHQLSDDIKSGQNVYVSAAVSIDYASSPINPKYIRGENIVSCWAMREMENKSDWCIFEWLLCLDLKGKIPRYVLDTAYKTLMQDYMQYLRTHCDELRSQEKSCQPKT